MKKFSLFLMLLTLSTNLIAKCGPGGLSFFPWGEEIYQNSIFMLEGDHYDSIVVGLNKKYPIYLRSGKQKIKLVIFETQIGEYGLSQVLLKPVNSLEPNKEYELIIENFPIRDSLGKSKTQVCRKWKVKMGKDEEPPKFKEYPKELSKTYVHMGCGPGVYANFSCKVSETSEYLVKTVVKDMKTGSIRTYYLRPSVDSVGVGHGMCQGAFVLKSEEDYEVAFSLIDASGNENLTGQKIVRFKGPKAPKYGS
jgi:hypothetical protein